MHLKFFSHKGVGLALAFALMTLAAGCSKASRSASHVKKAEAFFEAGDYDSARLEYMNVLRLTPDNTNAVRRLGFIYYDEGALLSAAPFLLKAAEWLPDDAEVHERLAHFYAAGGELDKARDETITALKADPSNVNAVLFLAEMPGDEEAVAKAKSSLNEFRSQAGNDAVFRLADAVFALRQRQQDEAMQAIQDALKLDDQLAPAYFLQASLFEVQSNLTEADKAFKRAADLSPVRSERRVRYAEYKLRHGEIDEAKALLEAQVKEAPDYLPALSSQARLTFAQGKLDEALTMCNSLLSRYAYFLDAILLRARIRTIQNEPAKGIEELERVERVFGKSPQYLYQMAMLETANKEINKAATTLEQIVQTTPAYTDAVLLLARINLQQGRSDLAIQRLSAYLKLRPANQAAQMMLANACTVARKYDEALAIYRDYASQNPKDPRGPFLVGLVLRLQQQTAAARQEFEQSLTIEPKFLSAAAQLVELDLADQKMDAALTRANSVVEQASEVPGAYLLLARVQLAQTNRTAAEASLKKAIDLDPETTAAYYLLARLYRDEHQLQPALEQVDQGLVQNPDDVRALMLKGMLHSELKEPAKARDAYEKLLEVQPDFAAALNNLAYIYIGELPDLDKAWRYARRAYELQPNAPETADTLGWVYFKRGEYVNALRLISAAAEKLPDEPEVQYHLGMAHYMMAQETAARSALERAVLGEKDYQGKAEAKRRLELLTSDAQSSPAEAIRRLEAQVKQEPNDVLALSHLADWQLKANQRSEAQTTLEAALKINPDLPQATITLAELKALEGQRADALRLVRHAHDVAPNDGDIAWRGGQVAMDCHDYVFASVLLEDAARRTGDRPDILADLAEADYVAGRIEEAADLCRRVADANPAPPVLEKARQLQWLIDAYLHPKSNDQANSSRIAAILKEHPDSVPAQMAKAGSLVQEGKPAEASAIYENVTQQVPGFPQAHRELALLYAADGPLSDPAKAYDHAVKAREKLSGDAVLTKTLGLLTYRRGDTQYAEQLLKEAQKSLPTDPEIKETLKAIGGN